MMTRLCMTRHDSYLLVVIHIHTIGAFWIALVVERSVYPV